MGSLNYVPPLGSSPAFPVGSRPNHGFEIVLRFPGVLIRKALTLLPLDITVILPSELKPAGIADAFFKSPLIDSW